MAWCLAKYGARPIDYYRFRFFEKNRFERNKYFTFYRYLRIASKLKNSGVIFADKSKEYERYSDFIARGWISTFGCDVETIRKFIVGSSPCIAKPNGGEQGKGIFTVDSDKITKDPTILETLSSGNYVLEQKLSNCKELSAINPTSLNTLRVYTLLDRNGKAHILNMILRVGKTGADVDNWGAGGVGYEINIAEGIIHGYGIDKQGKKYIKHPGTDCIMIGYQIPRFSEVKSMVNKLCLVDAKARLVGWDIAVTPDGPELIEMNCPAGHDFLQAFGTPYYHTIKKLW